MATTNNGSGNNNTSKRGDKQHETGETESSQVLKNEWIKEASLRLRNLWKTPATPRTPRTPTATTAIIMAGIIIRIKQENTSDRQPSYCQGFGSSWGLSSIFSWFFPFFFGTWIGSVNRELNTTHGFRFRSHFRGDLLVFAR